MFGDTHHIQPACVRGPDDLNDDFLVALAERLRQVAATLAGIIGTKGLMDVYDRRSPQLLT
jgi:hypothetical protein